MATVVLGGIGSAIAGPVGGAIGSALGSYIDQAFIFPAIFGGPEDINIEGRKLDDLNLQTATEGAPIPKVYGPGNRLAGNVIWVSDLIEVKTVEEEEVGGKGGDSQTVTQSTYSYYVDIAISVCKGEISSIKKIWADSKILYDASGITLEQTGNYQIKNEGGRMQVVAGSGDPDWPAFETGFDITITGAANPENNGTWILEEIREEGDSGQFSVLYIANPNAIAEPSPSITVTQDLPPSLESQVEDVRIYTGTDSQTADSVIESYEGSGNVPGYRGIAYVRLKRLFLGRYGNRIPQMSFLVEADAAPYKVSDVITGIMEEAGLDPQYWSVSPGCEALDFGGMIIPGPTVPARILESIIQAFDLIVTESGSVLEFKTRAEAESMTVEEEYLAAEEESDDPPPPIQITDLPGYDIPTRVDVDYVDPDKNYQTGSQGHMRQVKHELVGEVTRKISLPITMSGDDARAISRRLLWRRWDSRQSASLQLSPRFLDIEENDLLTIGQYQVRVTEAERGVNGIVIVKGLLEGADIAGGGVSDDPTDPDVNPYLPPFVILVLLDTAPLRDVDATVPGFYFAMCAADPDAQWIGSSLYTSPDGVDFLVADIAPIEARIGDAQSVLADGPGYPTWDRASTVDVYLNHGELSSRTELEVLDGANRMFVGNELIAFQTATLVAPRTYRLSKLIRGLRDTDQTGHTLFERCVFVSPSSVRFRTLNLNQFGSTRFFKGVAIAGDLEDAPTQELTFGMNTLKPFRVCDVSIDRDDTDNITITWKRRSRALARILNQPEGVPLLEPVEKYEVDVMDGSSVVRTIETNTGEIYYPFITQVSDGFTLGDPITFRIYQISASIGRGRVVEITG